VTDQALQHPPRIDPDAEAVLAALDRHGWTVSTAESLTGGLLAATLVDVPGASASVRGGIVAYATDVKASVLGVDRALLKRAGAVDPDVAAAMARGARRLLATDVAIATTGVAGPDPQDDKPVGTLYVAVSTPEREAVRGVVLSGSRAEIRRESVRVALRVCLSEL
jgi:nicotinamide-nucleotide amidase